MRIALVWLALAVAGVAVGGCTDLSAYNGDWSGSPVADPSLLAGMSPDSVATMHLDTIDRYSLQATLTIGNEVAVLRPIARAANDTLGAMDLPDAPLRSFVLVAPLAAGDAIAIVSLYGDERVDLRLLRSDELYVVYHFKR